MDQGYVSPKNAEKPAQKMMINEMYPTGKKVMGVNESPMPKAVDYGSAPGPTPVCTDNAEYLTSKGHEGAKSLP